MLNGWVLDPMQGEPLPIVLAPPRRAYDQHFGDEDGGHHQTYPDSRDYVQDRLVAAALPGVAMLMVTFGFGIAAMLWACTRRYYKLPQCGLTPLLRRCLSGHRTRVALLALYLTSAVALVLALLLAVLGGGQLRAGSTDLFSVADAALVGMGDLASIMGRDLSSLGFGFDTSGISTNIAEARSSTKDLHGATEDSGSAAFVATVTVLAAMCLCFAFALAAFFHGRMRGVAVSLSFVFATVGWCFFTMTVVSGTFLDDTCVQLQRWEDCKLPTNQARDVQQALLCDTHLQIDKLITCVDASDSTDIYNGSIGVWQGMFASIGAYDSAFRNPVTGGAYPGIYQSADYVDFRVLYPNSACNGTNMTTTSTGACQQFSGPVGWGSPVTCAAAFGNECVLSTGIDQYDNNVRYRERVYSAAASRFPACAPVVGAPTKYNATCISPTECPFVVLDPSSLASVTGNACAVKAILATTDIMWTSSTFASCSYLTAIAKAVVGDGGPCQELADGFILAIGAHALAGSVYLVVAALALADSRWRVAPDGLVW